MENIKTSKELKIAILSPSSSSLVEQFTYATINFFLKKSDKKITFVQYTGITAPHHFKRLMPELSEQQFDAVLALTNLARCETHRCLYTAEYEAVPILVLTYEQMLQSPLPSHIYALTIPDRSTQVIDLLNIHRPLITTVFTIGRSTLLHQVAEGKKIAAWCHKQKIVCKHVAIDNFSTQQDLFAHIRAISNEQMVLYLPLDSLTLTFEDTIIRIAKKANALVITTNLYALNYGADIATGYQPAHFAEQVANHLIAILKKENVAQISTMTESQTVETSSTYQAHHKDIYKKYTDTEKKN